MIRVNALTAFNDNYIWLIQNIPQHSCTAVDPGEAEPVLTWLAEHPDYHLSDILVTHHHADHTGGIARLKKLTGATVYGPARENIPGCDKAVDEADIISLQGLSWQVLSVPGHTLGHIAFYQPERHWLFCGDTLFAGGCGRIFEGTAEQMLHSLQRLAALPARTAVFCAHEYTLSNLQFARAAEPGNPDIEERFLQVQQMRANGHITLPSSIALECRTNPFLHTHDPELIHRMEQRTNEKLCTQTAVFAALRSWKNQF